MRPAAMGQLRDCYCQVGAGRCMWYVWEWVAGGWQGEYVHACVRGDVGGIGEVRCGRGWLRKNATACCECCARRCAQTR